MEILMLQHFGNLKKGQVYERGESTANKLVKMGIAKIVGKEEKQIDDLETKEFKGRKKTK
jgi:uroporphyrinogen-III synthase